MIVKWNQKDLENAITKLFEVIKPEGVISVKLKLKPSEIHDEKWILRLIFIVPDDSSFLNMEYSERVKIKTEWRQSIKNNILNFLGADVSIEHISLYFEDFEKNYRPSLQQEALKKLENLLI
jgi:hypothetical protein